MKLTVVIAAFRPDTTGAAIDSILRQSHAAFELFVVTQGESHETRRLAEARAAADPRVRSLHLSQPGASRARNAGALAGDGDAVAILDDDCEARADWLAAIDRYLSDHPEVGVVGGSVIAPPPDRPGFSLCPDVAPTESIYDPGATPGAPPAGWDFIGCNLAIRRATIERAGLFDPCLGPGTEFPAGEDVDYKLRLEALAIPMGASPGLVVHHSGGRRYGLRAGLRTSTNYAWGNGGLAGKLTLAGDPRGAEWLRSTARDCLRGPLSRPWALPKDLNRLRNYAAAYRRCLAGYRIEGAGLAPRSDA
ncbi:MAG: glycosyltransferase family 2 protein [Deltaproteobacteria bacterium]|nr:glycosyltransferase family 2 protein [Deltaproteobacteria bacterium]